MKIVYLSESEFDATLGQNDKIAQQIDYWSLRGSDVIAISTKTCNAYNSEGCLINKSKLSTPRQGKIHTFLNHYRTTYKLISILDRYKPDLIYSRYLQYTPFLSNIVKKYPTVFEINSNDLTEYKAKSKITYLYNRFTRNLILSNVAGYVCVTGELLALFKKFRKPSVCISNGLRVDSYPFVKDTRNKSPKVVFIGSPGAKWHGFEKVALMAKKIKNVEFHIIGPAGQNRHNLTYHGYMHRNKAMDFIKRCDVAIGTLSLYAKNMFEACPLKSRQYMAHGIPFIYAYQDPDLNREPFALQIPNAESNVRDNLHKIKDFIFHAFGNNELRLKCRDFAKNKVDVTIKEQNRLEFLKGISKSR